MLSVILGLLPKVGPVVAALPEFKALVDTIGSTLNTTDQAKLQSAYALAKDRSDKAHADLQQLVADHG